MHESARIWACAPGEVRCLHENERKRVGNEGIIHLARRASLGRRWGDTHVTWPAQRAWIPTTTTSGKVQPRGGEGGRTALYPCRWTSALTDVPARFAGAAGPVRSAYLWASSPRSLPRSRSFVTIMHGCGGAPPNACSCSRDPTNSGRVSRRT
eukprot:scaffold102234_cov63-Phaeocystis_antarctica.AAC.3